MHKAIKELYDIVAIEQSRTRTGYERRDMAIRNWVDKWLYTHKDSQLVMDMSKLTIGFKDALMLKVSQDILLKVLEECVTIDEKKRSMDAELLVVRKKPLETK